MKCKICNQESQPLFKGVLRGKHDVQYFKCVNCGFIQTEEPHWLEEAYASPINLDDTGILWRNMAYQPRIAVTLGTLFAPDAKYLDFSGGYGIFTRLMRDLGFDYYWDDPYTQNLLARGFEKEQASIDKFAAITAFEAFEHFVEPKKELEKMLKLSDTIIFSTALVPEPTPMLDDWWYYGKEHGQHVALYSVAALQNLASQYNLELYTNGTDLHVLTKQSFLPRLLPAYLYNDLVAKLGDDKISQTLVSEFYSRPSLLDIQLSPKALLSSAYRNYKSRKYFTLDLTKANAQHAEQLRKLIYSQPDFVTNLLNHLLANGDAYFNYVQKHYQSKTMDDMLLMRQRMAAMQTNN